MYVGQCEIICHPLSHAEGTGFEPIQTEPKSVGLPLAEPSLGVASQPTLIGPEMKCYSVYHLLEHLASNLLGV